MRKIILLAVVFATVFLIAFRISEIEKIVEVLKQAMLRYFFLALLVEVIWFGGISLTYKSLYKMMDIFEGARRLAGIAISANFINVVAPTGGIGGVAIFVNDADKRGHPHGRVVAASALYVFLDYISFLVILALGFTVLLRRNILKSQELIPALFLLGVVIFAGWLIFTGARSPEKFGGVLAGIIHRVNKIAKPILRKEYMSEGQILQFGDEIGHGLAVLRTKHKSLVLPFIFLMFNRGLQIFILALSFLSFNVDFTAGSLVAGYAIGTLFLIVSPTPSGIGIVEGGLPLALAGLHIPFEQAVIVTLVYRAVTFWFPLALGGIAFRILQPGKKQPLEEKIVAKSEANEKEHEAWDQVELDNDWLK